MKEPFIGEVLAPPQPYAIGSYTPRAICGGPAFLNPSALIRAAADRDKALVAAEAERCAKIADEVHARYAKLGESRDWDDIQEAWPAEAAAKEIAARIRSGK